MPTQLVSLLPCQVGLSPFLRASGYSLLFVIAQSICSSKILAQLQPKENLSMSRKTQQEYHLVNLKSSQKKEVGLSLDSSDISVYSFNGRFEHHCFAGIVLSTVEYQKRKNNYSFNHHSLTHSSITYILSVQNCPWPQGYSSDQDRHILWFQGAQRRKRFIFSGSRRKLFLETMIFELSTES